MEEKGTGQFTVKYDSWILKIIKTHGLSVVLMLLGLHFLNGRLSLAEEKIASLESRLYECYEKRIESTTRFPNNTQSSIPDKLFILPEQIKTKKDDYSLI